MDSIIVITSVLSTGGKVSIFLDWIIQSLLLASNRDWIIQSTIFLKSQLSKIYRFLVWVLLYKTC